MARHNREADGCDQRGFEYTISYQPDWLRQVKVTRLLDTGRQSTKTLFTNPDGAEARPGRQVRTAIRCPEQGLDVEVTLSDPKRVVRRVIIETGPANGKPDDTGDAQVQFTIENQ